jgi:hypothetical protein
MTTLTEVLINVHAHLIFFCQFQFLTNQRKFEQDRFQKFQKKITYCIFIVVHILLG